MATYWSFASLPMSGINPSRNLLTAAGLGFASSNCKAQRSRQQSARKAVTHELHKQVFTPKEGISRGIRRRRNSTELGRSGNESSRERSSRASARFFRPDHSYMRCTFALSSMPPDVTRGSSPTVPNQSSKKRCDGRQYFYRGFASDRAYLASNPKKQLRTTQRD